MEVELWNYFDSDSFIFSDVWLNSEAVLFSPPHLIMHSLCIAGNQQPENFIKQMPSSGKGGRGRSHSK